MLKTVKEFPTNEEFNELFSSVEWGTRAEDKINKNRESSCFAVKIYDGDKIIGMARVVGDGSYYTIYDVVVRKEYQRLGVGKMLMGEVVNFYKSIEDVNTYLYLGANKDQEGYFEQFGFETRPDDSFGAGMYFKRVL